MAPPETIFSSYLYPNMPIRLQEQVKLNECRNCPHIHYDSWKNHCSGVELVKGKMLVTTSVPCLCSNYAPKDNLEYLEYLYESKNK